MKRNWFVDKLILLSEYINPSESKMVVRLSDITGERKTTIHNWLHNENRPPKTKLLKISDSLGVHPDCLINEHWFIKQPEMSYNKEYQYYHCPCINENNITTLHEKLPLVVHQRKPFRLNFEEESPAKEIERTYCTTATRFTYPPLINEGDLIFFNPTGHKSHGRLCFYFDEVEPLQIVKIHLSSEGMNLIKHDSKKVHFPNFDTMIPIVARASEQFL